MSEKSINHACVLPDYFIDTLSKLRMFTCVLDSKNHLIYVNELAKNILKASSFDKEVGSFFDLKWLKSNPAFSSFLKQSCIELKSSPGSKLKTLCIQSQDQERWFDFSIDTISCEDCEDKVTLIQGVDITRQQDAETKVNLSNQRLNSHKNQAQIAMIEWDQDLQVIDWNPAAQKIFGYNKTKALSMKPQSFFHLNEEGSDGLNQFLESFIDDTKIHIVTEVETNQKEVKTCDWYNTKLLDQESNIIGYTSMVLDVTSDLKMLQQVQQAEKMLALNSVVGGVVHDFNNILMVVLGYSDLISTLSKEASIDKYAKGIHKATERGMRLAKKLNSFLKRHSDHPEDLVLSNVLDQTSDILKRAVGSSVLINFDYQDDEWSVNCDRDEFEDAILNMCINSAHAMNKAGTVDISVSNVQLVKSEAKEIGLNAGEYVLVKVSVTGIGMTKAVVKKVLEPYFTTKGDQGTGLGLCQVYGFMKRSKGSLQIRSFPKEGTSIYLFFPRALSLTNSEDAVVEDKKSKKPSTILIVDDSKDLGYLYCEILKNHGYNAIAKLSSYDAIDFLKKNHVDVLITDVVMPKMNGYELAEWVIKHRPQIKIQLISGYTKSKYVQGSKINIDLTKRILDKPVSTYSLVQRVWELVDVIFCDNLATGIKEIDDDHQILIEMINSLNDLNGVDDSSTINQLLVELMDYCDYHFKNEESLMDKYDYPDKDHHKETHEAFAKSIEKFCLDINKNSKDYKILSKYLLSWLTKHIATLDKDLADYIHIQEHTL